MLVPAHKPEARARAAGRRLPTDVLPPKCPVAGHPLAPPVSKGRHDARSVKIIDVAGCPGPAARRESPPPGCLDHRDSVCFLVQPTTFPRNRSSMRRGWALSRKLLQLAHRPSLELPAHVVGMNIYRDDNVQMIRSAIRCVQRPPPPSVVLFDRRLDNFHLGSIQSARVFGHARSSHFNKRRIGYLVPFVPLNPATFVPRKLRAIRWPG